MSKTDKIKQLRANRDISIDRISILYDIARQSVTDPLQKSYFKVRYQEINDVYDRFNVHHENLVQALAVQDNVDLEIEKLLRQEVDKKYFQIRTIYYDTFEALAQPQNATSANVASDNVKLPSMNIPTFSGDLKDWHGFISLYDSLIHNRTNLTNIQKFQYLLSSLTGDALSHIRHIPLLSDNYDTAYSNIHARYHNKRALAKYYWDAIYYAPKLSSECSKSLRRLLDLFSDNLKALEKMVFPVTEWDYILMNILSTKLDSDTLRRFELQHGSTEVPTYDELFEFLEKQCVSLETLSITHDKSKTTRSGRSTLKNNSSMSNSFLASSNGDKCPVCCSQHTIYKCPVFLAKLPRERFNMVKQNKWCSNCLGKNHILKNCSSNSSCRWCGGKHHSFLHFDNVSSAGPDSNAAQSSLQPNGNNSLPPNNSGASPSIQTLSCSSSLNPKPLVLLSTALVNVMDSYGIYQTVRVLIDCASQANFITEKCVKKLGIPRTRVCLSVNGINQTSATSSGLVSCKLKPCHSTQPLLTIEAAILPTISANMPASSISVRNWIHLSKLTLADPNFNISSPIDMLLGADIFPQILIGNKIEGSYDSEPFAIETVLGWIVMGKAASRYDMPVNNFLSFCHLPLDDTLKQFWELEKVPDVITRSPQDEKCEKIFKETHTRLPSGRYVVSLPFLDHEPYFGDTRYLALKRFYSLERRLKLNPSLHHEYSTFMKEYLLAGYMEAVENPLSFENIYYIPHLCVRNPNSSTTKLRVVFDASSKSDQGYSLNDTLLVGEKLQRNLVEILLNFRRHPFVFSADIKHMFLRILINELHQDYQRILWRFSPNDPVQDFRLKTVTFGVSSSPHAAIRTLLQLAEDEGSDFPKACKIMQSDIYVDDVLTGSKTLHEAKALQSELVSLLSKGGFQLRKWSANHNFLLKDLPPEDCQQTPLSFDTHDSVIKILGMKWFPTQDCFSYEVSLSIQPCTKRGMLSEIARLFDPLGIVCPITFLAKYLIQHLWSLGLGWDEKPPSNVLEKWSTFRNELQLLSTLKIPRLIIPSNYLSCEIHGFADSSEKGYGCVIYFRFSVENNRFVTYLVGGKSKVAPLKSTSIPRLELCAAVLLAKFMHYVIQVYSSYISFANTMAWSDSMIALSWIKSSPHRWKTFVSNRVSYIQERLSPSCWFHVSSTDNPADCASRGLTPQELLNHPLWFQGPSWLNQPQSFWPRSIISTPSEISHEEKQICLISQVSLEYLDNLMENCSSLEKITGIVAQCLRFIFNTKNPMKKKTTPLNEAEHHEALLVLVKAVQVSSFSHEISQLQNKAPLPKQLRKLNPFLAEDGLLRVGGRLQFSGLSFTHKHPALLPNKHRLTDLIIGSTHCKYLHPGLQTLQFLLAQNFWILSPKRAIYRVISKCYRCFRVNPKPLSPPMGCLPEPRINQLKCFQCVGVDYGGPYNITMSKGRGVKSQKAYICLFVCFATKAIHLELASDLSSEAFLAALRRFISRRGRCTKLFSDNATNFTGAYRILCEYMRIASESERIEWSFSPPGAPHFNGLSEAGIKSVKTHLLKVLDGHTLTYEEFYTILVQVEAILNSRPLYAMSSDPNDLGVITPGHFLTMEPLTTIPDPDLSHLKVKHLDRWQFLLRVHGDLWKRWRDGYLHTLQQRHKWLDPAQPLEIGDLVLIKNELTPPLHWRMGRVIKLHAGQDGTTRVVTLRTAQGTMQRPCVKICPLPKQ